MPNKLTQEEFEERVANNCRVKDIFKIDGKYILSTEIIKGHCVKCGTVLYRTGCSWMYGKRGCLICAIERNKLKVREQSLEQFNQYLKDNSLNYTMLTTYIDRRTKVLFHCEDCNNDFEVSPAAIFQNGQRCPYCDDGLSFPNKLLRNLFSQLKVDYVKFEYSPDWANGRAYDCYFILNNKKYIIEADGDFHNKTHTHSKLTIEEIKEIDKLKDKMALEHNIEMIRIKCNNRNYKEIVKAFKGSPLKDIFNFDELDWNKIQQNSMNSLMKKVCEYRLEHPELNKKQIADYFSVSEFTIKRYISFGKNCGLIPKLFVSIKGLKQFDIKGMNNVNNGVPLCIYNENNALLFICRSISSCRNKIKQDYNIQISPMKISRMKESHELYKGFKIYIADDKTVLENQDKII